MKPLILLLLTACLSSAAVTDIIIPQRTATTGTSQFTERIITGSSNVGEALGFGVGGVLESFEVVTPDQITLLTELGGYQLVGRSFGTSGPAEAITVLFPLYMEGAGELSIADEFVDAATRMPVRYNSGATVWNRNRLNFIPGAGAGITVAEDVGNDEVDITISASGVNPVWVDLDGGTSLTPNTYYREEITGPRTLTWASSLDNGEEIIVAWLVIDDATITFPASWRTGTSGGATVSTLNLNPTSAEQVIVVTKWQGRDSGVLLTDTVFVATTSADLQDGTIVNADISASAAIAISKLATDPLARANHTGTQAASTVTALPVELVVAISDETTALSGTGTKVTFRMPYAMTVTAVRASLTTASSSGTPTFDINEGGVSILGTKLTIDASEKTSVTAATAATITDTALADDAEITIDLDVTGTNAAGGKILIKGTR